MAQNERIAYCPEANPKVQPGMWSEVGGEYTHRLYNLCLSPGEPADHIIKIFRPDRSHPGAAQTSVFMTELAREHQIAVPEIEATGISEQTGNRYIVMEKLTGHNIELADMNQNETVEIIRKLHNIPVAGEQWGWIDTQTGIGKFNSWADFIVEKRSKSALRGVLSTGIIPQPIMDHIIKIWPAFLRLAQSPTQMSYLHGDFSPANLMRTGKGIELLDMEQGLIGDPLYDLSVPVRIYGLPALEPMVEMYCEHAKLDPQQAKPRILLYSIFRGVATVEYYQRTSEAPGVARAISNLERDLINLAVFNLQLIETLTAQETLSPRDLRADLHMHAKLPGMFARNDERHFLSEVAKFTFSEKMNLDTIAITNHIEAINGMDDLRASGQVFEDLEVVDRYLYLVSEVQHQHPDKTILAGIEASIDIDGSINVSDKLSRAFDLVIASIHRKVTSMNPDDYTYRIITAIRNPCTRVIGHIGRYYPVTEQLDWDKICCEASIWDKAIEINLSPILHDQFSQKDVDIACPLISAAGLAALQRHECRLSLGSDLHHLPEIDNNQSIRMSRWVMLTKQLERLSEAGIKKSRIINTYSGQEIKKWLLNSR